MLKSILVVTVLVLDLGETETAYREQLEYQLVERGEVPIELARSWNAPAVAGNEYLLMQPASGAETYLRFIAADDAGNYEPMKTLGWNAVEILVEDPDALAAELSPEVFDIVGPPKYLTDQKNVRAFQAFGPSREMLYFTRINDPAKSTFNLGSAQSRIDRVFIMVLASKDIEATRKFYAETLMQTVLGPWPYRIGVLSNAWGLPADTLHSLSMIQLDGQFALEIDEYPVAAPLRSTGVGQLPFGAAIVTFEVASLQEMGQRVAKQESVKIDSAPYNGRASLTITGPSGELIELVEQSEN